MLITTALLLVRDLDAVPGSELTLVVFGLDKFDIGAEVPTCQASTL